MQICTLAGPFVAGTLGYLLMALLYLPVLHFYRLSAMWALLMPVIGTLFLAMTWTSAIRYWRGERSRWKGRRYPASRGG